MMSKFYWCMKTAPKFLLSSEEGELYITHTQKPFVVFRLMMLHNQPKGLELITSCGELPEEKRMVGLKKRMMDWYIFKHHSSKEL